MSHQIERVLVTEQAERLIEQLKEEYGSLIFHQSGGCCDGSSPMCFQKGEFIIDQNDVWLGAIAHCDFYMSQDQFEYWKHTQLTVDIVTGRGASFSLEIPLGFRFVIKSRVFSNAEINQLIPVQLGEVGC